MKDLDITAVFCEMLSGIALMLVVAGWLDVSGACSLGNLFLWLKGHPTFAALATVAVVAYLAGLVVDAIGMAFDEVADHIPRLSRLLEYDAGTMPAAFYANVSAHVLKFWCEQWAYFSCYRNLLLLSLPGVPCVLIIAYKYGGARWTVAAALSLLVVIAALIVSIRALQRTLANTANAAAAGRPAAAASDDAG